MSALVDPDIEGWLTPEERAELDALLAQDLAERPWSPLPGPQTMAYYSEADVIGFGGAAGGGKTDLAIGKVLTQHRVAQVFRRDGTELSAIIDRMEQVLGHRSGLGGRPPIWRKPGGSARLVEFCSAPNLGDEKKFQGRAKDLLVVDEAANFLESQVRFLMGWVRTTERGQRTQTLLTFNPPTTSDGRWIVRFFAPWLDDGFKGERAQPGELRYVAVIAGEDRWVDGPEPFVLVNNDPQYDFDPADFRLDEIIRPQSRTFIPSRISDNPYLVGTNYMSTLQSMPEPLRSQMLYGDFKAGMRDDAWQVLPTAWVEAAMARWQPRSPRGEMLQIGVDVGRGGDPSVIATRHRTPQNDMWFAPLITLEGDDTSDGDKVAMQVLVTRRDDAPINIDVIGVGASPFDSIRRSGAQVWGVNVAEGARGPDKTGALTFHNLRAELWWRLREALEPTSDTGIALPPDDKLKAELCAPRWSLSGKTVKVESRDDIIKRLGHSPDRATAVVLALISLPKVATLNHASGRQGVLDHNPMARR